MDIKENIFMKKYEYNYIGIYVYKMGVVCLCNKYNVNLLVLDFLVLYLI